MVKIANNSYFSGKHDRESSSTLNKILKGIYVTSLITAVATACYFTSEYGCVKEPRISKNGLDSLVGSEYTIGRR